MGRKSQKAATSSGSNNAKGGAGSAGSVSKDKTLKGKKGKGKEGKGKETRVDSIDEMPLDTKEALSLDAVETLFLRKVSIHLPKQSIFCMKQRAQADRETVQSALQILETYHMCILHNALSAEEMDAVKSDWRELLDFKGPAAVGEKDASKRSGTRLQNCRCQVGPNCKWEGWRPTAERSQEILDLSRNYNEKQPTSVWKQVIQALDFIHVARVEVVTSHPGCRAQNWHIDGIYGMTVIFALEDVDLAKGPTQFDFTHPFNSFREGESKIKNLAEGALPTCRAAMPAGSVLMFNCNVSHRGTSNISTYPRPILVLDCKPQSVCLPDS
jgi:hypothetical protein